MRTPLTVATGLVLAAGVVVGVTIAQASSQQVPPIQPVRVQAPAVATETAGTAGTATLPVLPEAETATAPREVRAADVPAHRADRRR